MFSGAIQHQPKFSHHAVEILHL